MQRAGRESLLGSAASTGRFHRFPRLIGLARISGVAYSSTAKAAVFCPDMMDEQGLAGYKLSMNPNSTVDAPDPSQGDGQYFGRGQRQRAA